LFDNLTPFFITKQPRLSSNPYCETQKISFPCKNKWHSHPSRVAFFMPFGCGIGYIELGCYATGVTMGSYMLAVRAFKLFFEKETG